PHRGPETSPEDMEPIIAGRDLRKSWGATLVLEHADFLLHGGDKVALVGPNGSGKSTLFRLLAGETAPDLGDLVLKPGLRYGYLPRTEVQGAHRARPREREGEGRPPARRADEPHGRRHDRDDRGVPAGDRRGRPPGEPRQVPPRRDRGQGDRDRPPPHARVRRQL